MTSSLWYSITAHLYHLPWQRLAWLLRVTYMCKSFNATKNLNERILASLNIGRVVMKIVDVTVSTQCPQGGVPVTWIITFIRNSAYTQGKLEFFHSNFYCTEHMVTMQVFVMKGITDLLLYHKVRGISIYAFLWIFIF